jgi:hypothetical protein
MSVQLDHAWDTVYSLFDETAFDYRGYDFSATPVSGIGKFHYLVNGDGDITGVTVGGMEFWKAPF